MNTTALKRASEYGGPIILGAGMTLLAVALVTPASYDVHAAPAPTVTVTPPPQIVTFAPAPQPTPRATATIVAARPVALRLQPSLQPPGQRGGPGTSGSASSDHMAAEQAPSTPAASPPACAGRIVAVQLPLGVLPDCAVTLGGSR